MAAEDQVDLRNPHAVGDGIAEPIELGPALENFGNPRTYDERLDPTESEI